MWAPLVKNNICADCRGVLIQFEIKRERGGRGGREGREGGRGEHVVPDLVSIVPYDEQDGCVSEGEHVAIHSPETDAVSEGGVYEMHVVSDGL